MNERYAMFETTGNNEKEESDAKFLAYMNEARNVGRTMLQVMAGRQYGGAECAYADDLMNTVPTNRGFFIVGELLSKGEKYGVLEPVKGARGKGYRIVPERLDDVRSLWQI